MNANRHFAHNKIIFYRSKTLKNMLEFFFQFNDDKNKIFIVKKMKERKASIVKIIRCA